MAPVKDIIETLNKSNVAYRIIAADFIENTKDKICRRCAISPELYYTVHFDLAYEWFQYWDYLEYTARVFLVSKIFHWWWNQQLAQLEDEFLHQNYTSELSADRLREALFDKIITMDIIPSRDLLRLIHSEGVRVIKENPELEFLKIYRNV